MDAFRPSGRTCGRGFLCAAVVASCWLAAGAYPARDPWQAALSARAAFEAGGSHDRAAYAQVMDEFRLIYHANPADPHASRAAEQVAELLAEQGHELGDGNSLRAAAGQYEWIAKAYPGGSLAPHALAEAVVLFGTRGVDDAAGARRAAAELRADYPHSAEAHELVELHSPAVSPPPPTQEASSDHYHPRSSAAAAAPTAPRREGAANQDSLPVAAASDDSSPAAANENSRPAALDPAASSSGRLATVTGIRHWSTSTYTRVAIDLGDQVQYQAARVENPDRIFFDLHDARLAPQLEGKSFNITDDGFLTRIRAAQFSGDVTRVVLDVHEVAEYSAFLLPNPYRLIIDIHGKPASGKPGPPVTEQATVDTNPTPAPISRPSRTGSETAASEAQSSGDPNADSPTAPASSSASPARGGGEVSSLPPMPVTDGSAGFGLPSRRGSAASGGSSATSPNSRNAAPVAQPRVVISSRPTTAKPVPNTVTTRSTENGTELAAVSDQPGKVVATNQPTSQPIVARSASASPASRAARNRSKAAAHVDGAPVEAAPPTADGETSLVRALGLKIGRIVIDAGHGGHDSGTLGVGGIEEKDVVLDVALRLGKLLHDRLGAEIVYTRADDTFIPLETRTAIANKAQADLFISVHANSSQDPSARGIEVYYLNFTSDPEAMTVASRENAVSTQSVHELSDLVKKIALKDKIEESRELAGDVDQSLYAGLAKGNSGLKDRGVKKAPFVVLIGANMPSILAEISFVTNPQDASELDRPEYRERVAESLYKGVARYEAGINAGKAGTEATERAARQAF